MLKILKYSLIDLARSRWSYIYLLFYLALGFTLLFLNNDLGKAVITLMNVVVVLVPLISTIFGVMYYYSSQEFTELLLAMPIKRRYIFLGQYLGVATSLALSLFIGLGLPFLVYGLWQSEAVGDFALLLLVGTALTYIFTALSFNLALIHVNRIKGFGYAVLLWLFMAVVYDGLFLIALIVFENYPLDAFALLATALNPIDLSRTLILLRLDISALMGYTGAVFKSYAGTTAGLSLAALFMLLWIAIPLWRISATSAKKDF